MRLNGVYMQRSVNKTTIIFENVISQGQILFKNHGFKKTTVNNIALKSNISKKTLYEIFISKEEILFEILNKDIKVMIEMFENTFQTEFPFQSKLLSFCQFIFTDMIEQQEDSNLWGLYIEDKTINTYALQIIKSFVINYYDEGIKNGIHKPIDSSFASDIVMEIILTTFKNLDVREDTFNMLNETLSMIADSIYYKNRLSFKGYKKDYYKILGVDKNAALSEIKKAYRKKALLYHPDTTKGDIESKKEFIKSQEANEILSNPAKKSAYDKFIQTPFSADSDCFVWDNFFPDIDY